MRKVEVLTKEEKQELEAMKKNYPTYTERDRASGILLSYRGYSPKEIAEIFLPQKSRQFKKKSNSFPNQSSQAVISVEF